MHAVCTIVVRNCIAQARVWARSCVEHNPRAQFYALVIDGEEEDRVLEGLGEAVLPRDLPIPASTLDSMQVMYRLRRHHVGRLAPVPRTRRDLGPPAHQPRAARGAVGTDQGLSLIHISEPTRLGMISYAVFCLKKKKKTQTNQRVQTHSNQQEKNKAITATKQ